MTNLQKRANRYAKIYLLLSIMIFLGVCLFVLLQPATTVAYYQRPVQLTIIIEAPKLTVQEKIIRESLVHGVNTATALRIARCESSLNPSAKNPRSSAKGVYQFIDSTWRYVHAQGHQFDEDENIRQFMLNFPNNPQWWSECL